MYASCKISVGDIICALETMFDLGPVLHKSNAAHPNFQLMVEIETSNKLARLEVCLNRLAGCSTSLFLRLKTARNIHHIHFNSCILPKVKRNLFNYVVNGERKICTQDMLDDELRFLR